MNQTFNYGSGHLTSGIALAIASGKTKGVLSADAVIRVNQSQKNVQDIIDAKRTVYGINTGFGAILAQGMGDTVLAATFHHYAESALDPIWDGDRYFYSGAPRTLHTTSLFATLE